MNSNLNLSFITTSSILFLDFILIYFQSQPRTICVLRKLIINTRVL